MLYSVICITSPFLQPEAQEDPAEAPAAAHCGGLRHPRRRCLSAGCPFFAGGVVADILICCEIHGDSIYIYM